MNILERVLRRITRATWNKTVHAVITRAYQKRVIDSRQMHWILGVWNAECFPERGHTNPAQVEGDAP